MEGLEGEGPPKNEKGIRSSVGYTKKPSITTADQVTTRNITTIM